MTRLRLLLLGSLLALGIGGGFAPWVYRPPVALQLTPPGLAEYVKFLPEMRFGLLPIQRLYFLLPLVVAAYGLSLLAVNRQMQLPPAGHRLLRLLVLPAALNLLSPIWAPSRLLNAEFRLQTFVAAGAIGLALLAWLFRALPLRYLAWGVAILAVGAAGLALQQFYLANEAIAATYAGPVKLGWGGWLTGAGAVGLVAAAAWLWLKPPADRVD